MLETNDFEEYQDINLLKHTHSDETKSALIHTSQESRYKADVGEEWVGEGKEEEARVGGPRDYHARDEFDLRWFIRIILTKLHHKSERSVFAGSIRRSNDDRIPNTALVPNRIRKATDEQSGSLAHESILCHEELGNRDSGSYHIMTFSGTGEALTPAGGSDCIRYD